MKDKYLTFFISRHIWSRHKVTMNISAPFNSQWKKPAYEVLKHGGTAGYHSTLLLIPLPVVNHVLAEILDIPRFVAGLSPTANVFLPGLYRCCCHHKIIYDISLGSPGYNTSTLILLAQQRGKPKVVISCYTEDVQLIVCEEFCG